MASRLNITVKQHATFNKRFVWRDKNGRAVNLTGWTAKLQVRSVPASPDVLLEFSTTNGRIALYQNGTIELMMSDEDTGQLAFKNGAYDLVLETPTGEKIRLLEGKLTVSDGVTRG